MDGFKRFTCTKRQAYELIKVFRGGSGGVNLEDGRIFRKIRAIFEDALGDYQEELEDIEAGSKEAEGRFEDAGMLMAAMRRLTVAKYELEQQSGGAEITIVLQDHQYSLFNRIITSPAIKLPLTDPEQEDIIFAAIDAFQEVEDVELKDGQYVVKEEQPSVSNRGERRRQDRQSRKLKAV